MKFERINVKTLKIVFFLFLFVTVEISSTSSKAKDIFGKDQV